MKGKIKLLAQAIYSVVVSPLLILASGRSRHLHEVLSRPLEAGEFNQPLVQDIESLVFELESGKLSDEAFVDKVSSAMSHAVERGDLDSYLSMSVKDDENIDITLKRKLFYVPLKWWYLKLHFMAPGNVHGLHAHRNVISTQVIVRGKLKVQEYDRLGSLENSPVKLKARSDGVFSQFATIQSTDSMGNVHGFEPVAGPAVRFQFYLRGHTSFLNRFPKRGRLYVEPLESSREGQYVMATIGEPGKPGES